jgi:hypothetical protein
MQWNPQCEARQAQTTRDVSGAVTRAQQQMATERASHDQIDVMSGCEARNELLDATMRRGDAARRGTVTANDTYSPSGAVRHTPEASGLLALSGHLGSSPSAVR